MLAVHHLLLRIFGGLLMELYEYANQPLAGIGIAAHS
jgi:hypothetical protein